VAGQEKDGKNALDATFKDQDETAYLIRGEVGKRYLDTKVLTADLPASGREGSEDHGQRVEKATVDYDLHSRNRLRDLGGRRQEGTRWKGGIDRVAQARLSEVHSPSEKGPKGKVGESNRISVDGHYAAMGRQERKNEAYGVS